jgi:uncharacterized protein (DUF305 family)
MNQRLILIATLIVMTIIALLTQRHAAHSATFAVPLPTAPAEFTASTERTFDQLMGDSMNVMHKGMHSAPHAGDPDRDFIAMMIPHHQGAIDMAKAILLYGRDEQLKRLAQEIIADQQNEVQLMQLWLSKHPDRADPTNALNK